MNNSCLFFVLFICINCCVCNSGIKKRRYGGRPIRDTEGDWEEDANYDGTDEKSQDSDYYYEYYYEDEQPKPPPPPKKSPQGRTKTSTTRAINDGWEITLRIPQITANSVAWTGLIASSCALFTLVVLRWCGSNNTTTDDDDNEDESAGSIPIHRRVGRGSTGRNRRYNGYGQKSSKLKQRAYGDSGVMNPEAGSYTGGYDGGAFDGGD